MSVYKVLRFGATDLPFPSSDMSPAEAKAAYHVAYPSLIHATAANDPTMEGDKIVYVVEKAPVKTKG